MRAPLLSLLRSDSLNFQPPFPGFPKLRPSAEQLIDVLVEGFEGAGLEAVAGGVKRRLAEVRRSQALALPRLPFGVCVAHRLA